MLSENPTYGELTRCLQEGATAERRWAAQQLRRFPEQAVEPLCAALEDPELKVRCAAAESLGHLRDPNAVSVLVEALRHCLPPRTRSLNGELGTLRAGGVVVGSLLVGIALAWLLGRWAGTLTGQWKLAAVAGVAIVYGMTGYTGQHFRRKQQQNLECEAISTALRRIAERHPTPDLRAALPELKAVTLDLVQQAGSTRAAARRAAARIETLTAGFQRLPIAAVSPEVVPSTLPRSADRPETSVPC